MYREYIEKGLAQWDIFAQDDALERLEGFCRELVEANKVMNLTAITEPEQVAVRHILDSLYLLKCLELKGKKIIDIGCGAGFPGMPLKLFDSSLDITMLDSTAKRIEFIKRAAQAQGACAVAVAARAEEYVNQSGVRESFDIATSRAVAPLNILAELSLPYVAVGGFFAPMKSATEVCDREIEQAQSAIKALGGNLRDVIEYSLPSQEGRYRVLVIEKVRPCDKRYPRRFSKISAAPL